MKFFLSRAITNHAWRINIVVNKRKKRFSVVWLVILGLFWKSHSRNFNCYLSNFYLSRRRVDVSSTSPDAHTPLVYLIRMSKEKRHFHLPLVSRCLVVSNLTASIEFFLILTSQHKKNKRLKIFYALWKCS